MLRIYMLIIPILLICAPVLGEESKVTPEAERRMIAGVAPSIVRVEYTLKYDKGEAPQSGGFGERCPNCGNYHGESDGENYVNEERPLVAAGFMIAPDRVVTRDRIIHPRFIESIRVRGASSSATVKSVAWVTDRAALILTLDQPLDGATPLAFDGATDGPLYSVSAQEANGRWTMTLKPASTTMSIGANGTAFRSVEPTNAILIDKSGKPVAINMRAEGPAEGDWIPPDQWPTLAADEITSRLDAFASSANSGILRVHISFRSPKKKQSESYYSWGDDTSEATELNVPGILLDDGQLLVVSSLDRKTTARLKRILVHIPDAESVEAEFVGTLKEYGAFFAKLKSTQPTTVKLSSDEIDADRHALLLAAEVRMQGEQRVQYVDHARIASYERRWKSRLYPELAGNETNQYLFDLDGNLRAFSIQHRAPVTVESDWNSDEQIMMPSNLLAEILSNASPHFDATNVPLTEEEENRLAWLGVELQPLGEELARANKVSDITNDGSIGGMVSYVYENSPAAQAGIELGDILIRLHIDGEPKPLDVDASGGSFSFMSEFPWEQLDELPEEYFDQLPTPWPSADSALNRALTDAGFGRRFVADVVRGGDVMKKEFTIVEGPAHYDSAPKYKSEPLDMTVRDLTYELRRYFHIAEGDAGVIVSTLEPGSKASIAGMKPFEIITHVNDEAVRNIKEFETQIEGKEMLRLSVKRMTKSRIVTIRMDEDNK